MTLAHKVALNPNTTNQFIWSQNSNHTFLVAGSETFCVVEEFLGDQVQQSSVRGWTECIDVKGDYIKKKWKPVCIVPPRLGETWNVLNDPRTRMNHALVKVDLEPLYKYIKQTNTSPNYRPVSHILSDNRFCHEVKKSYGTKKILNG